LDDVLVGFESCSDVGKNVFAAYMIEEVSLL